MSKRASVLFTAMCVIWGIPYLLIKEAVGVVTPAVLVFGRTAIATALLLPAAMARRQVRPVLRRWKPLAAYTATEIAVPWLLLSHAERRLPSSLAGLLVAAVPLAGVFLAWLTRTAHDVGGRQLLGLILGLGGVVTLVGVDLRGGDLAATAMMGVVIVGYATGPFILARFLSDLPAVGVVASSLALCVLCYSPLAATELPRALPPARALAAILLLGVICTAVGFVVFFSLVAEIGALRSTVITYVNPAVAVVLGVGIRSEPFTVATGAGFALILAGSFLATRPSSPPVGLAGQPSGPSG